MPSVGGLRLEPDPGPDWLDLTFHFSGQRAPFLRKLRPCWTLLLPQMATRGSPGP